MAVNEAQQDIYTKLAFVWSDALWGWADHVPSSGVLQQILKENFTEEEVRILSDIPLKPVPLEVSTLDEIEANSSFSREKIEQTLDSIAERGLLFKRNSKDGKKGYALLKKSLKPPQKLPWQTVPVV